VNRFLLDDPEPIGVPRRGRSAAALAVSAALHGAVMLTAVAIARSNDAGPAGLEAERAGERVVQLLYVPPAPPRRPVAVAPLPTRPRTPAASPSPRVPEHDEPAGGPSEPAAPQAPVAATPSSDAPAAPASPTPAASAPSTAELMRNEAQRLFGRQSRPTARRGGPAAEPGFEIYLPPQSDGCTPVRPQEGAPVELVAVSGRVYRQGTRTPLAGAHLQMIGTPYVAFSDAAGAYDLRFDPALVDRCRTQYVRVTAPGFRAQTLVLYLGPAASNDIPMSQR
jgi:hypothetical protein